MKCLKCQHFNDVAAQFCAECASPLAVTCVHCGHQRLPTAKFCPECGQPTGMSTSAQPRFGSLEAYTPRHLATKILNSRTALEGERKQVTVLFADLKGSMELLADRDPEDAQQLLDPVLEHMMEAVHHYEGTVNQVMGDGIMALFGAPVAHEDHAVRACYAALRMQERIKRHAEGIFHHHGANLQIRVGLNSGGVVVGTIRSDLRMDYTAVGRTTHLAARMEQLASPGSILLTSSTLELAEGFVSVKSLGAVPIKGLADPLEVHELTGVGPARTRFHAVARRGLTRFVGRHAELEQLRWAQQLAGDGHGQVVALVAEAGVGKSRLVYELTHSQSLEGWLVLEAAAVSYGKAMSYLPIVSLLRSYFEIRDEESLQAIGDKIAAKLLALDHALEPMRPALLALLGAPVSDAAWLTLDPAERQQRMLDAIRHLLLREARKQPLLLIVEDLHWIDGETQALLDRLVESLGSIRILLLATYRPEYQHGWASKTYYSQVPLDALPAEGARKLLNALLGDDPALAPLKQLLVKRGNPFFLEETIRTLVETKALEGPLGHYRLTRPVDAVQVPATVQVMLAARIDRLSSEDKRLLQVSAVVGRRVPFSLLRAVAELTDEAIRSGLDSLQSAEFVYETGLFPDLEYSFRHALTQDVAYGGLLQEHRRELHARIVHAIETLHHDRVGEHIDLLAHHALRGELREKAVSYLFQAGLKAGRHSALRTAAGLYDQALLVLETLPDSQHKLEQSFDILRHVRSALTNLGETRKALQRLREAEPLAEKLNDESRRGLIHTGMCVMHCYHGELDDALANGARALAIAERIGDASLRSLAVNDLIQVHWNRGEYERVVELATGSPAEMPGEALYLAHSPGPIWGQCNLVRSLAELGRFAEAARHADEVLRSAETIRGTHTVGMAHLSAGLRLLAKGDWLEARPLIERGLAEYRKGSIFISLPHAIASSALMLAHIGEVSEALSRLQEGAEFLDRMTAHGTIDQSGMDYHWLGRAALLLGRLDDARRLADCSLKNSPLHPGYAAHVLHLLGDLVTHPDQFDAECGETYYRKALTVAERLGMRPLVAHCHLGLGKLYQHTGKREQAGKHLTTATALYREMEMPFWLQQAEAETSS
jgi:class 3 adenylate cyclase/tetratricopeptide (TPR) repeat protein